MMNEFKEHLEKSVKLLAYRIKNFDEEKLETEEGNIEYNKLIVQKAVLSQKLKYQQANPICSFAQKIMRKMTKKTLICDRF